MSRRSNKVLVFISIFLLIANIALLTFIFWPKGPRPQPAQDGRRDRLGEALRNEVGFNEEQMKGYEEMNDRQRENMKLRFNELRAAKDSLFYLISVENLSDSVRDVASDLIAQRQKALDLEAFGNFKEIRKICSGPDQEAKYDSLVRRMFFKMSGGMRRNTSALNPPPGK